MLINQQTFVIGKGPLTDRDVAFARQSLTYNSDKYLANQGTLLAISLAMLFSGLALVTAALTFVISGSYGLISCFGGAALAILSILPLDNRWNRRSYDRRMQRFLSEQRVRIWTVQHPYWQNLILSIPDPGWPQSTPFGWRRLAKAMTDRTPAGEVLNGMIVEELTLTLPRLEEQSMDKDYADGEDVPDLGSFWVRRAQQFGAELHSTYLAFHPAAIMAT